MKLGSVWHVDFCRFGLGQRGRTSTVSWALFFFGSAKSQSPEPRLNLSLFHPKKTTKSQSILLPLNLA